MCYYDTLGVFTQSSLFRNFRRANYDDRRSQPKEVSELCLLYCKFVKKDLWKAH